MKRIIFIVYMVGLAGCTGFLEETSKSSLSAESFFQSEDDLQMATNSLYYWMQRICYETGIQSPFMGADDVTTHPASNMLPFRQYDTFSATDDNEWSLYMWERPYGLITAANHILDNYESANASDQVKKNCAGQAYYHRALGYYHIVRTFGPCPLVTTCGDVDTKMEKSSVADVYALITSDLENAEELLPDKWTASPQALGGYSLAPTSGSAKSLLASVYLTMAGWPLKQTDSYTLAAAKAKEVIDREANYGYGLMPIDELYTGEQQMHKEMVYACAFNSEYRTCMGPFAPAPQEENGWCCYMAEINFFNAFPEGPRKDVTFQTDIQFLEDDGSITTVPWDDERTYRKHPYYAWNRIGTACNMTWENRFPGYWKYERTQIMQGYADVLLIYAEAQAMSVGADVSAYNAINRVRERAGLEDLDPGLSSSEFQKKVIEERGWEFAGLRFTSRWYDLVRMEMVEEVNQNRHEDEIPLIGTPSHDFYYAPIPYTEKLLNPNLAN